MVIGAAAVFALSQRSRSYRVPGSLYESGESLGASLQKTLEGNFQNDLINQKVNENTALNHSLRSAEISQNQHQNRVTSITQAATFNKTSKIDIVDEFIQDLRMADPTQRHKAIWELGQRGDTRAVQPLIDLLVDSDSKQHSLILSALSEIGVRTLKPMTRALAISLQDENAEVRKNAIRDLTRMYDGVAQLSHLLHNAMEDSDPDVRDTAGWAMGQLNRIRSIPKIPSTHEHESNQLGE